MPNEVRAVGLHELRTHLSSNVHAAAAGARIVVTDRGHPVAELGPFRSNTTSRGDVATRIAARGCTPPSAPFAGIPMLQGDGEDLDVTALLDELRGGR